MGLIMGQGCYSSFKKTNAAVARNFGAKPVRMLRLSWNGHSSVLGPRERERAVVFPPEKAHVR